MKAIGLMSGTSVDGIDAVLIDVEETDSIPQRVALEVLHFATYPYPDGLRERILNISTPGQGTVEEICHLNAYLGELFARAARRIAEEVDVWFEQIEVIGSHGQTIHHLPQRRHEQELVVTSTFQIGEPSIIAERTGVTTVADFRPRDMAAGGQGAPFAPYAHYLLFRHPDAHRIINNIGGISNLTYLPPQAQPEDVVAFDTGPGNMVIDQVMDILTRGTCTYDDHGTLAAQGSCHDELLAWMMEHPYLTRQPPKSTGREEFGAAFVAELMNRSQQFHLSQENLLATATAFTVETIVQSYQAWLPCFSSSDEPSCHPVEVFCCGGGVQNVTLMALLQERLAPWPVGTVDQLDIPSDALEAIAFALLAREAIYGRASNLSSVTGANYPVVLGKIIPGTRFKGVHS